MEARRGGAPAPARRLAILLGHLAMSGANSAQHGPADSLADFRQSCSSVADAAKCESPAPYSSELYAATVPPGECVFGEEWSSAPLVKVSRWTDRSPARWSPTPTTRPSLHYATVATITTITTTAPPHAAAGTGGARHHPLDLWPAGRHAARALNLRVPSGQGRRRGGRGRGSALHAGVDQRNARELRADGEGVRRRRAEHLPRQGDDGRAGGVQAHPLQRQDSVYVCPRRAAPSCDRRTVAPPPPPHRDAAVPPRPLFKVHFPLATGLQTRSVRSTWACWSVVPASPQCCKLCTLCSAPRTTRRRSR